MRPLGLPKTTSLLQGGSLVKHLYFEMALHGSERRIEPPTLAFSGLPDNAAR